MPGAPSEGKALQRGVSPQVLGDARLERTEKLPLLPGTAAEPEPGRTGRTKGSLDCLDPDPGADVPAERIL